MGNNNRQPKPDPTADLELFASFVRSEERKERDAKAAARQERRRAEEHSRLVKAKEDAAATVKRLRASDRASAEEKAQADEAYRTALAAVVASETGEAPAWAPPADDGGDQTSEGDQSPDAADSAADDSSPEAPPTHDDDSAIDGGERAENDQGDGATP